MFNRKNNLQNELKKMIQKILNYKELLLGLKKKSQKNYIFIV